MGRRTTLVKDARPNMASQSGFHHYARLPPETIFENSDLAEASQPSRRYAMDTTEEHESQDSRASSQPTVGSSTVASSEPAAPISRKRSVSDRSDEARSDGPLQKKQRVGGSSSVLISVKDAVTAVDTNPAFNREQWQLLQRSVAIVLDHVGFDSASKEALESLCAEAESYAMNFLGHVRESMLSARRSQPIPTDFEFALRCEGLTDRLLRPHLNPPISPSKTRLQFELADGDNATPSYFEALLGEELSGASEKEMRPYIPKQFPDFPSRHTYRSTEVMPERERDPRKIREKATEAARHGEEALRRLVNIGKAGDNKGVKKSSEKNIKQRYKHGMWENTMESLATGKMNIMPAKRDEEDEQSILVDAGKQYRRKPVAGSRG